MTIIKDRLTSWLNALTASMVPGLGYVFLNRAREMYIYTPPRGRPNMSACVTGGGSRSRQTVGWYGVIVVDGRRAGWD